MPPCSLISSPKLTGSTGAQGAKANGGPSSPVDFKADVNFVGQSGLFIKLPVGSS